MAQYHYTTTVRMPFEKARAETIKALQRHGFGVLTEIDVESTLKKKLGASFRPYHILGACNPEMAFKALQVEDKIGTMLPCNAVLQQKEGGAVEISAVDPVASMQAIDNPALAATAEQVRDKLREVVDEISRMPAAGD